MPTRFGIAVLAFGLVAVVSCSKTLTEKSAARILQKASDARRTAETRKLGRLVVDECRELLLQTDTVATAKCRVHVDLTEAGVAANSNAPTEEEVRVIFRRKPDGTWINAD